MNKGIERILIQFIHLLVYPGVVIADTNVRMFKNNSNNQQN